MSRPSDDKPGTQPVDTAADGVEALDESALEQAAGGSVIVDFRVSGSQETTAVKTEPDNDIAGRYSPAIDPAGGPRLGRR